MSLLIEPWESSDESGPLLSYALLSVGPCHAEERSFCILTWTIENFTMKNIVILADELASIYQRIGEHPL
jgi:hypothetical protein